MRQSDHFALIQLLDHGLIVEATALQDHNRQMAAQKFSCDSNPRCPSTNDANVGSDASPGVELMQILDHLVVSLLSSRAADWRCDSQRNTSYNIIYNSVFRPRCKTK